VVSLDGSTSLSIEDEGDDFDVDVDVEVEVEVEKLDSDEVRVCFSVEPSGCVLSDTVA